MNNLISVIIPVYNNDKYLKRCLESVCGQTHQNLEIIIVNDGSEDNSAEIIEDFSLRDKRVVVFHQENQGVSAARNKGLHLAKGDCIGFVDADDILYEDMYEFLFQNLENYNADISHCGFELVKPDATIRFHGTGDILIQNKYEALIEILSGVKVEPSACTKLYRKCVLKNVFFPLDIKINEDLLFNVEAFHKAHNSVFKDTIKYKYFSNPCSASRSKFTQKKATDLYAVAVRIYDILKNTPIREQAELFYVEKLLTILQALQSNKLQGVKISKKLRHEISTINVRSMGIRICVLKTLLLDYSIFYPVFRFVYDLLFMKKQKWKNH